MSILDDAIREHLALKRAHGADEAELKRLEDEAFGPPQRPDEPEPFAEAPTEFLDAAEAPVEEAPAAEPNDGSAESASGRRESPIADLQEAPTPPAEPEAIEEPMEPEPVEDEQPAAEHEAIADQPTELFDVEEAIGAEAVEAEAAEEPLLDDEEEEDDFFSEQRLSDELNQALEAPVPGEPGSPVEYEDDELEDAEDEGDFEEEAAEQDEGEGGGDDDEDDGPATDYESASADHEDVLEDTPDFLEDAPEDDDLWFEQRPPKDFDFDD